MYLNGDSCYSIALAISNDGTWNGEIASSTVHALADAYVAFIKGKFYPMEDQQYLSNRAGILGFTDEDQCFTFKDLVCEIGDGHNFYKWLSLY